MKNRAIDWHKKLGGHDISTPSGIGSGIVREIVVPTAIDVTVTLDEYVLCRIFRKCF